MDLNLYRQYAAKTESVPQQIVVDSGMMNALNLLNSITNLVDKYKKQMFYGRTLINHDEYVDSIRTICTNVLNNTVDNKPMVITNTTVIKLLHSMIGTITETAGELPQLIYELVETGNTDNVNLNEEYGDVMWYIDRGLDAIEINVEDSLDINIAKLKARYSDGYFDSIRAVNRDLDNERNILEGKET